MTELHTPEAIARSIVAAHASRFGEFAGDIASFSSEDPIYRGAKQACSALGFIDIDAECLARAWQAQTKRVGMFDAHAWPEHPADFGMRSFPPGAREDAFPSCPEKLGLYSVLPDAQWVGRMARAGVPTVQLRFKSNDDEAIAREVNAAVQVVQGTGSLLFINDHWRAAIEARAYGLHLGQEDLDALTPEALKTIRDSGIRLGVSTHGYAEMVRADAVTPSYIAMGAIYPTTLKQMATAPQGVARLAAYARLMRGYPQVGIGGVDAARMPEVLGTGVGSVAVVRALVADSNPEAAAVRLLRIVADPANAR
ncbi:thiamine phosphate synthase [Variovorax sp. YR216]|uniref:thiamine phosphate synthase n=1 Tax=Variovorax sp. YR216 TaxID=1882828 RepID=UPI000B807984|nr:thiamine phosphate synthase [Variovorax sp. YR216]